MPTPFSLCLQTDFKELLRNRFFFHPTSCQNTCWQARENGAEGAPCTGQANPASITMKAQVGCKSPGRSAARAVSSLQERLMVCTEHNCPRGFVTQSLFPCHTEDSFKKGSSEYNLSKEVSHLCSTLNKGQCGNRGLLLLSIMCVLLLIDLLNAQLVWLCTSKIWMENKESLHSSSEKKAE